jgi:hypothetical protein
LLRNDDTIYNWKLLSVEEALELFDNLQSTVSSLVPDVARALKLPMTTPIEPKLVTVNTSNAQEMISLGDELEIKNDELKLTGKVISNPNILVNGDFKVNQRGQTSYSGTNIYTVDRWRLTGTGVVDVLANGIKYTAGGGWTGIRYFFEKPSQLSNKTFTISAKVKGSVGVWCGFLLNGTNVGGGYNEITTEQIFKATLTFGEMSDNDTLFVRFTTRASGDTLEFEWVKFEVGSVATAYSPRPYAEELAMCQRYYQKLRINDTQYCANESAMYPNVKLIQTLRTKPTISVITYPSIRGNGSNLGNIDNLTSAELKDDMLLCSTNPKTLGVVLGQLYMITNGVITADAEIY